MEAIQGDSQVNDIEVLKKKEDEHLRLQRQVRMIQADRQNSITGVHPQFRRQDQLMRTLKKEYINLVKDLKIAKSGAHKKNDKKMKKELKRSLLFRVKTEMDCEAGVTLMDQLNGLLRRKNKEMLHLRKLATASQGQLEERRSQSEQRLVSAENKLEAAMLRFNAVQCENKNIRERIEHMLKDRVLFNQGWDKMLAALGKGKKFLTDLFESSTLAYDQRDEWCTKLRSVQEKGKMDQMLQVQEMRDLQKAYDHEMKLYNFLSSKGVTRVNRKQELREEEERRREEEDTKRSFNDHLKILDDIREFTEETDINKIIDEFLKKEQDNFSIYKLLTDYCAENEVLGRDLKRIRQELVDRQDWNEMMECKRQNKLAHFTSLVEDQRAKTEAVRQKNEETDQFLHNSMHKIGDLFSMLECSLEPFQNLLGDKQPTLHQLNLSLRLITDKIQTLIQIVYYNERSAQKKKDKTSSSRLKKYTVYCEPSEFFIPLPLNILVPAEPCPSCVETRWLSRVCDAPESPFDTMMALSALAELAAEPAYVRSDRVHTLADCRVPRSRAILAKRYLNY